MPDWPDWAGEVAVVVATGPSAAAVPLDLARGRARVLAVKDAWRLCPWADALYACDHHWWEAHGGVLAYQGQRIAHEDKTIRKWRGLEMLQAGIAQHSKAMLFADVGTVGGFGNSGGHAVNLAAQFGARAILMVGIDYRVDMGLHFFGAHPYGGNRPSVPNCTNWAARLDAAAPLLAARGIRVINCSAVSALNAYEKMEFSDALSAVCLDRV